MQYPFEQSDETMITGRLLHVSSNLAVNGVIRYIKLSRTDDSKNEQEYLFVNTCRSQRWEIASLFKAEISTAFWE